MNKIVSLIGWIVFALVIVYDTILSKIWAAPDRVLTCSGILQGVLDLNTGILRGQGVSAAIAVRERGYWAGASGLSEPGKPVQADMLFNIASIGKNFLAALALQLAEEVKLSLDDPIAKWGLGSPTIDAQITVRQLLNHTSGVYDWATHRQSPFIVPYREIDHAKVWTQDELLDKLGGEPYFSPGTGWHYSTTNYNLLRFVAEKVTGTSALVEIQNRFLRPLGLEHTLALGVDDPIPPHLEMVHSWIDAGGHAGGHAGSRAGGEVGRRDVSGDSQAWIRSISPHMMLASALDLARWSQALYGGDVLGEASLKEMLDFHRPTPGEPPVTGYGLGTEEIAVRGLFRSYGHLGYHYGSMSAMLYLPRLRTSVVVLTNENNHAFQYGVAFSLLALILARWLRPALCFVCLLILTVVLWRTR